MPIKKEKINQLENRAKRLSELEKKGYTCTNAGFDLRTNKLSNAGMFLAERCKYNVTANKLKRKIEKLKKELAKTKTEKTSTKKINKKK
jgi:transcription initiation factor IIE alpha subunit